MNSEMKQTLQQMFTEAEWCAIYSAMKDYADYGDEAADVSDTILQKITALYQ